MSGWISGYADALNERLVDAGVRAGLSGEEEDLVLDLAREVAHATERVNAPLSTFVAGHYVAIREAQGTERGAALQEAIETARELLGPTELPQ